jgi:amino acid transporter/nucleotide-binding universal stress UspA family protein
MLFGDWGTSRLYVLGLAFFYSGHSSPYHILAMCGIMLAVGWSYTVVCRCFQDGGGVYSSAKATHKHLALLGAYLLFADYVITAALSAVDAFRYFGASTEAAPLFAIAAIFIIAGINFVGPRKAGSLATLVAMAVLVVVLIMAAFCIPHLSLRHVAADQRPFNIQWTSFVHIILALSGVEAIANMTGIMVQPVKRTSRRAIWLVLAEVIIFNLFFAVIMTTLTSAPLDILANRPESMLTTHDHDMRDTMMKVIAAELVHPIFATVAAVIFGLLLLSATNTATSAMISVQYAMARDGELPPAFVKLNAFGVPWLGLVTAVGICTVVLLFEGDVEQLAHLYAIGVVGAITINLGSTCFNRQISVKTWERILIGVIASFLLIVECTIAVQKVQATIFAGSVILGGYLMRLAVKKAPALAPHVPRITQAMAKWFEAPPLPEAQDAFSTVGIEPFDPAKKKILVACRGSTEIVKFAAEEAEARDANLIILFVRDLRLAFAPVGAATELQPQFDPDAVPIFATANKLAREKKLPYLPIYCVAPSAAEMILDFAGTYAVDYVIMGASRRGSLFRAMRGDVISEVAANLPKETTLLIHA